MEEEVNGDGIFVQDLAGHAAEAGGAGGVRARRPHHHRPHHVENGHLAIMASGHVLESAASMPEKPTILVVDDDQPIVMLMRKLLGEFGFDAVTATSGAEALEAARARPPALVLLDK